MFLVSRPVYMQFRGKSWEISNMKWAVFSWNVQAVIVYSVYESKSSQLLSPWQNNWWSRDLCWQKGTVFTMCCSQEQEKENRFFYIAHTCPLSIVVLYLGTCYPGINMRQNNRLAMAAMLSSLPIHLAVM